MSRKEAYSIGQYDASRQDLLPPNPSQDKRKTFRLHAVFEEHRLRSYEAFLEKKARLKGQMSQTFVAGQRNIFVAEEGDYYLTQEQRDLYAERIQEGLSKFDSLPKAIIFASGVKDGTTYSDDYVDAEYTLYDDSIKHSANTPSERVGILTGQSVYHWAKCTAIDELMHEGMEIEYVLEPAFPFVEEDSVPGRRMSFHQFQKNEKLKDINSDARDTALGKYLEKLSEGSKTKTNVIVVRGTMHYKLLQMLPGALVTDWYIESMSTDDPTVRLNGMVSERLDVPHNFWIAAYEQSTGNVYTETKDMFGEGEEIVGDVRDALVAKEIPEPVIRMLNSDGLHTEYIATLRQKVAIIQNPETTEDEIYETLERIKSYDVHMTRYFPMPDGITEGEKKRILAVLESVPGAYQLQDGLLEAWVAADVDGYESPRVKVNLEKMLEGLTVTDE